MSLLVVAFVLARGSDNDLSSARGGEAATAQAPAGAAAASSETAAPEGSERSGASTLPAPAPDPQPQPSDETPAAAGAPEDAVRSLSPPETASNGSARDASDAGPPDAAPPELPSEGPLGELRRFRGHSQAVLAVAFSPDGASVLTSAGDGTVRVWEVEGGRQIRRINVSQPVTDIAYLPEGERALWCTGENFCRLWEVRTNRELDRLQPAGVSSVVGFDVSADGRRVLLNCQTRRARSIATSLRTWDLPSQRELGSIDLGEEPASSVAISPDGTRALSTAFDSAVRLWDLDSGRMLGRWEGHEDTVGCVCFSPDGRRALSGGEDDRVILWDVDRATEVERFRGHRSDVIAVAFCSDDRQFVSLGSGANYVTQLLDVGGGSVSFSVTRRPSSDRDLRVWHRGSNRAVERFRTESEEQCPTCMAISPDGATVLTGHADGSLILWGIPH